MITQIDLENFKCFKNLRLPLRPLTLLSGTNASGKSSVLQAAALLHQTICTNERSRHLILNGPVVQLGTVLDVVDKVYGRHTCRIGLVDEETSYQWMFTGQRPDMSMRVECVEIAEYALSNCPVICQHPEQLHSLLPLLEAQPEPWLRSRLKSRLRGLTYITAERLGPQEIYTVQNPGTVSVVGSKGEHAISVLHTGRDEAVLPSLQLSNVPATRLQQTEARMQVFFPGYRMDIQPIPQTNAVTVGLGNAGDTGFHRPVHAGFGLTQILPIAIAALSAQQDDLLLIENPEVHLHPAGQAVMGQFMADVAQAGVQVILETHSDHVLNGIRRAVKAGKLLAQDVALHFFKARSSDETQVLSPILDNEGNIDIWPKGFFDQFDIDMNYFAGWG